MCRPKGYSFCSVLVWKRVSIVYFGLESRVWFARKLRECEMYLPFQYEMRKKLKKKFANSKWILKKLFLLEF